MESEHGDVLNPFDEPVNGTTTAYNEALTLKIVPATGCTVEEVKVTHGILDANPAIIHSVPQVLTTTYTYADIYDGELTIPADIIDGDLSIVVTYTEPTGINAIGGNNLPKVIYDLQGRRVVNPGKGVYIINGKKVMK